MAPVCTPGVGVGRGPGREDVGGGSGGGFDGGGTPTSGGDPLGHELGALPIASSGGAKGAGGSWAEQHGGGGGIGGGGQDLAPSGLSYNASALAMPTPSYPALAVKEHQQGTVIIALTIGSSGQIVRWTFVRRTPSDALDNAALKALKQIKYRAAMLHGTRVTDTVKFSVTFKIGHEPEVKQI